MRHIITTIIIALLAALAMPALCESGEDQSAQNQSAENLSLESPSADAPSAAQNVAAASASAHRFSDEGDSYFLSGDFSNAANSYERSSAASAGSTPVKDERPCAMKRRAAAAARSEPPRCF
mgnify:CR=1 FL=1